jgi:hypothetical protein
MVITSVSKLRTYDKQPEARVILVNLRGGKILAEWRGIGDTEDYPLLTHIMPMNHEVTVACRSGNKGLPLHALMNVQLLTNMFFLD